jgi:hypothetical protein
VRAVRACRLKNCFHQNLNKCTWYLHEIYFPRNNMCRNTYSPNEITPINLPLWDWGQPLGRRGSDDILRASYLEVPAR